MQIENNRPAWLEIDIAALRHNIREIASKVGGSSICAVIKANAYSHGAKHLVSVAEEEGCRMLAVATCEEAVELKKAGCVLPVLVLSPVAAAQYSTALRYDIRLPLFDKEAAFLLEQEAAALHKRAVVHIAVDTGMSRIGLRPDETGAEIIRYIRQQPHIECEGIFTHFAAADTAERGFTEAQLGRFAAFTEALVAEGIDFALRHACNSGGIIGYPEAYYDMVRPGILLYGYYPSEQVRQDLISLKPALSVKARLTVVKDIEQGTCVSYGCKYQAASRRRIATLPLGYADGIPYAYVNGGEVLVDGRRAPIIGSICMDQMMLDVTDIPNCAVGTEAVLLGTQGGDCITPEEMAAKCNTIKYEILTGLNSRLCEKYINE